MRFNEAEAVMPRKGRTRRNVEESDATRFNEAEAVMPRKGDIE